MDLLSWFGQLARYNRIANEVLYEACSLVSDSEYRKQRVVSFGSIHALLNHVLLGDRIWMERFEGGGRFTPPLNTILFADFAELRSARIGEDARIEAFFVNASGALLESKLQYVNSKGQHYSESSPAAIGHFFNHQTHHRGQLHVMVAQAGLPAPSLDLHRILNP